MSPILRKLPRRHTLIRNISVELTRLAERQLIAVWSKMRAYLSFSSRQVDRVRRNQHSVKSSERLKYAAISMSERTWPN